MISLRALSRSHRVNGNEKYDYIHLDLTPRLPKKLDAWHEIYKGFLAERTFNDLTGKESFTHAKLVSAYRSLRTNLPYLFTYKKHKYLHIHNTTNSLDGGVFSPMKMLIKIHRGLSKSLKLKMVDDYLLKNKKN